MTENEAFANLYFGIDLYYNGVLVANNNVLYNPGGGMNDGVPRVLTYNQDGLSITLSVDGSYDMQSNVYARNCTVTTNQRCRVTFQTLLNQIIVFDGSEYGQDTDNRKISHGEALAVAGTTSYDIRLDLIDLWNSCTIDNLYSFGGAVEVYIWPFTHKILRDPTTGKILRGGTSNKILRDD